MATTKPEPSFIASPPGPAVVAKRFRDKDDFSKVYEVGEDVSSFDPDRLAKMAEDGVVTIGAIQTDPPA